MTKVRFQNGVDAPEIILDGENVDPGRDAKDHLDELAEKYGTVPDAAAWLDGDDRPTHLEAPEPDDDQDPDADPDADHPVEALVKAHTREDLDALAADLGIDGEDLANKQAVAEAIIAAGGSDPDADPDADQ